MIIGVNYLFNDYKENICEYHLATGSSNGTVKLWRIEIEKENLQINIEFLRIIDPLEDFLSVSSLSWSNNFELAFTKGTNLSILSIPPNFNSPFDSNHQPYYLSYEELLIRRTHFCDSIGLGFFLIFFFFFTFS